MKICDFFKFGSKLLSSTFQAGPVGLKKDTNGVSAHLNLIRGKYEEIDFAVLFKQDSGKKLTDILDTGYVGLYLVSDRMKNILEENDVTGWKVFLIKLYDKKGNEVFGYHGFSVIGRCGPVDYEKSKIVEKPFVSGGPVCKFYKGLYIGLDSWDGSDFFLPGESCRSVITQKAADVLKKNKITNMQLYNLSEYETSVSNIKNSVS